MTITELKRALHEYGYVVKEIDHYYQIYDWQQFQVAYINKDVAYNQYLKMAVEPQVAFLIQHFANTPLIARQADVKVPVTLSRLALKSLGGLWLDNGDVYQATPAKVHLTPYQRKILKDLKRQLLAGQDLAALKRAAPTQLGTPNQIVPYQKSTAKESCSRKTKPTLSHHDSLLNHCPALQAKLGAHYQVINQSNACLIKVNDPQFNDFKISAAPLNHQLIITTPGPNQLIGHSSDQTFLNQFPNVTSTPTQLMITVADTVTITKLCKTIQRLELIITALITYQTQRGQPFWH